MVRYLPILVAIAACRAAPTPAPGLPATTHVAPVAAAASPVRQDYEPVDVTAPGPLHEVLATGHECRQQSPGPIDGQQMPAPIPMERPPLQVMAEPNGCAPFVDGHRRSTPLLRPSSY